MVVIRTKHLRWLGLRSLEEVSAGNVMVKDNPQLCYTQPFHWKRLFKSTEQVDRIYNNKPAELCGEYVRARVAPRQQHRRLSRVQLAKQLRTTGPGENEQHLVVTVELPYRVSRARQFEPLVSTWV